MSVHVGGRGPGHLARSGAAFNPSAVAALDFQLQQYRVGAGGWYVRDPALVAGWSYSGSVSGAGSTVRTAVNSAGTVQTFANGVPRITDLGLLIEESRTNLLLQSQTFSNATWQKLTGGVASAPVVTANFTTGPDGTLTASRVQLALNSGTTSTDISRLMQPVTVVTATAYSGSIWLKSNTGSSYSIYWTDNGAGSFSAGKIITVTPQWQRFTSSNTSSGTSGTFDLWLRGTFSTSDSADISAWGAQLEVGAFATSYIPTVGASVSRAADVASIGGLVLPTNFGVVEQIYPLVNTSSNANYLGLSDGTTTNRLLLQRTTSNKLLSFVAPATSSPTGSVGTLAQNSAGRMGANLVSGAVGFSAFGEAVSQATGNTLAASSLTQLDIGSDSTGAASNGFTQRIIISPNLSNAQLQALTQ